MRFELHSLLAKLHYGNLINHSLLGSQGFYTRIQPVHKMPFDYLRTGIQKHLHNYKTNFHLHLDFLPIRLNTSDLYTFCVPFINFLSAVLSHQICEDCIDNFAPFVPVKDISTYTVKSDFHNVS